MLIFLLDDDQIVTPDLHLDRVYERFIEHNLDILAVRQGGGGQPMMLSPLMNGKRIWMHRGEYKRIGPVCWCDMVSNAFLARLGGDEFGVLVQTDFQHASELSKRLELSLASPIYVHQTPRYLSVSIGVAERTVGVDLIRAADEAMYIAKGAR